MGAAWNARNRDKVAAAGKAWRARNPERSLAVAREWKKRNRAQLRVYEKGYRAANPIAPEKALGQAHRYRSKHREQYRAAVKRWAHLNPHRRRASKAIRRALERKALPQWANRSRMAAMYELAARLKHQTGVPHHVDHIVPLNHPLVCGLHCEDNLQVLPEIDNLRKANRFEV